MPTHPVLQLEQVSLERGRARLLADVDWTVRAGEHWVVLGRNGSGKTTLVKVASLLLHPTAGSVTVLGETLGRTDVRSLRRRVGTVSAGLADQLRPALCAHDAVMTAKHAALEPWWHTYTEADAIRAESLLASVGCGGLGERAFGTLSSGERQRVQLARSLMADPALVLLDEPCAGLDLAGREELVASLAALAADPAAAPTVLVTHHVEEIPPGFTHVLLLAGGRVAAAGPLHATLTAELLGATFGVAVALSEDQGRWSARALGRPATPPDSSPFGVALRHGATAVTSTAENGL